MPKEITITALSVEEAVSQALIQLNAKKDECSIEILQEAKKGFLGLGKSQAVVRVSLKENCCEKEIKKAPEKAENTCLDVNNQKLKLAKEYLLQILKGMNITDYELKVEEKEDGAIVTILGNDVAVLIGHHGETLDSLQYLMALVCNKFQGDYYRITLDCGDYRGKREETLKSLAEKIAMKVKKTGRKQYLEPMNPYERRIIHAVISDIDGVFSKSKGEEPNRRVVVMSETPAKSNFNNTRTPKNNYDYQPRKPYKAERTMEDILKNDFQEKEKSAELYSKIEL
ncbi:MAG: RNA-binding cell elongation regulator Jag/EloR [Oscillospiraceae bacterium]